MRILFLKSFEVCNTLSFEFSPHIQPETWLFFQNKILTSTSQIEAKLSSDREKSSIAPELLTRLFEILFQSWIASPGN